MSGIPLAPDRALFSNVFRLAGIAGVVGVVICALCAALDPVLFFRAWLVAFCVVWGPALGSLVVIMLHYLVGGDWGYVIRRPLEAATRTLPFVIVLFLPIVFGIFNLYDWTNQEIVDHDEILKKKQPYLNVTFFLIRAAVYFAIWILLTFLLTGWSRKQDRLKSEAIQDRCGTLSGPGILLFVLTITFSSIDWVMSLEPHWYSTIFMAIFGMGQVLSGFVLAVAVVMFLTLAHTDAYPTVSKQTTSDLGTLMLAFIMVWAYLSFCQFLLIWAGNLPLEVKYYTFPTHRVTGDWGYVALALAVFHFALPFFLLMNPSIRRNPKLLAAIALFVLLMRIVEMVWVIVPGYKASHLEEHWPLLGFVMYPAAIVGVGGLWFAYYLWQLGGAPLMPQYKPEEVQHGQVAHH